MYKVHSVYQVFCFQSTCICPSFGIVMQNTLKRTCMCEIKCAASQNQHFKN